jgi:hypothetical protein
VANDEQRYYQVSVRWFKEIIVHPWFEQHYMDSSSLVGLEGNNDGA